MAKGNFWLGVIVGFIVMIVLSFLPVIGALLGGFVAGIIARGGWWNGAKAGFVAGIFGAIVLGIILIVGSTLFLGVVGFFGGLGVTVALIAIALYSAILGLVGGAIGGLIAK
jgi:hypothetical protein